MRVCVSSACCRLWGGCRLSLYLVLSFKRSQKISTDLKRSQQLSKVLTCPHKFCESQQSFSNNLDDRANFVHRIPRKKCLQKSLFTSMKQTLPSLSHTVWWMSAIWQKIPIHMYARRHYSNWIECGSFRCHGLTYFWISCECLCARMWLSSLV